MHESALPTPVLDPASNAPSTAAAPPMSRFMPTMLPPTFRLRPPVS